MAKIYGLPEGFEAPKIEYKKYDREKEEAKEEEFLKRLSLHLRGRHKGDIVGEEISTPYADGYARYMVESEKPFALVHLPLGDAWRADSIWERGLRLADARKMVERNRNPLFGNSAKR